MELERRRIATQQTLDTYRGRRFDWGEHEALTCVHLAHSHMVAMGHEPPEIPEFTTQTGAIRALKERGWGGVEDMLDEFLDRIAPAQMLLGDMAVVPGQGGLGAIFICAGPLKVFGWREDTSDLVILDIGLDELEGAWRV